MVWVLQNKIPSGMYRFSYEAMAPSVSLWSYKLSSFKQPVIALKRQRFIIRIEYFTWLQATLFLQNLQMSHLIYLSKPKIDRKSVV